MCLSLVLGHAQKKGSFKLRKLDKHLVVNVARTNILYSGIDNHLEIMVNGVDPSLYKIKAPGAKVNKVDSASSKYFFNVIPDEKIDYVKLEVSTKSGYKQSIEFNVIQPPEPAIYFAGVTGNKGKASISKIKAAIGVLASPPSCSMFGENDFKVASFSLSIKYKGDLVEKKSLGNRITPAQSAILQGLQKGSKVYIEDVVLEFKNGQKRTAKGVVVRAT